MKIRLRYVLPAMLLLVGCATTTTGNSYSASNTVVPAAAAPQRVDAVSDAVGAKMDDMLVSQPAAGSATTR
jgi:hypothetical protein